MFLIEEIFIDKSGFQWSIEIDEENTLLNKGAYRFLTNFIFNGSSHFYEFDFPKELIYFVQDRISKIKDLEIFL